MLYIHPPVYAEGASRCVTHSIVRYNTRHVVISISNIPFIIYITWVYYQSVDSVKGIDEAKARILGDTKKEVTFLEEDKSKIKAAIFYSISSTQRGLQVNKYYECYEYTYCS